MEALLQHNTRLQLDSEEHQALKGGYNALLNRSESQHWPLIKINFIYMFQV